MGNKPWAEMTPEQQAAHYERTKRWRASEKGRKARRDENRRYRAAHPEFVEAQKEYHREYYRLYRGHLLNEHRKRYRRHRAAILARQAKYRKRTRAAFLARQAKHYKRIQAAQRAEEQAIMRTMDAIEADAVRTFLPDEEMLGHFVVTKRADKKRQGRTHIETVAIRLAARKGEPLPPEPEPVRIGYERDDPSYKGVRYHARVTRKIRQYKGFASGKWRPKKRGQRDIP